MKILRARIPSQFASVIVTPQDAGVRLEIGSMHLPLSTENAMRLADAIVDAAEKSTGDRS